MIKKPQRKS